MTTDPPPRAPRLPHYIELWAKWTDEAEQLEREFDKQERLFLERFLVTHPQADPESAKVAWENDRLCQSLIGKGKWAHRKAQTYGLGVLILTLRQVQRNLNGPQGS